MHCAFKSFEGKNTQVQSMIAQDINDEKTIHQGMNLESLATKYSTFLATLSSQKNGAKVHSVGKGKWCSNCKMDNHNTEDCRHKHNEGGLVHGTKKQEMHSGSTQGGHRGLSGSRGGQGGGTPPMPRMQPMQTARRRRRKFWAIFSKFGLFLVILVLFLALLRNL